MIILWVNIQVRSPPSWNAFIGTTWLRFSSRPQFRTAQNDFSKFRPGWWQFCWMTGVKFNSIHSILVRFITQFTVCAAKNLTVFVADSPRCLEWSSMVAAISRALRELSEPCVGWTREPRGDTRSLSGHVGNTRRRRLITCCRYDRQPSVSDSASTWWPDLLHRHTSSRVSGNDRLFLRGSECGPNPKIPASPVIQLQPRPVEGSISLQYRT